MKLDRRINAIALLIFGFSASLIGGSLSAVAAPSSYQKTCKNISIEKNVLSALCKKRNGAEVQTSITLKGIENIDGTLKVLDANKIANFYLTCKNTSVNGALLSSECAKKNGQYKSTKTLIKGIENIDGVLKYTSSPM